MPGPKIQRVNIYLERRFEEVRRVPEDRRQEAIASLRQEFGVPEAHRDLFARAATGGARVQELAQRLVSEMTADKPLFLLSLAPQAQGSTIQSAFREMSGRGRTQEVGEPYARRVPSKIASLMQAVPVQIKPRGNQTIDEVVADLVRLANDTGRPHRAEWNWGVELIAQPGDSAEAVKAPFEREAQLRRERGAAREAEEARARAARLAALDAPLVEAPPADMVFDPAGYSMTESRSLPAGLNLITPEQLAQLPRGTVLRGSRGEEVIVGVDKIDGDVRGGFLALGFPAIPVEIRPSENKTADEVAYELVWAATSSGRPHAIRFPDLDVIVRPGDEISTVKEQIERAQELAALGPDTARTVEPH